MFEQMIEAVVSGHEAPGRALCAEIDPELFFPEKGGSVQEARKVCLSCDVLNWCREKTLAEPNDTHGIRAAMTFRERQKARKARRQQEEGEVEAA